MTTAGRRLKTRTSKNEDHEANYWRMADALRGSMDAAEYKHVVLGLVFLKYISDAFEEAHAKLEAEVGEGADPEDPDEYIAQNIFWVPPVARWPKLQAQAHQPTIGRAVDDAMIAIERDNPALKEVLPREYARPALDKTRSGAGGRHGEQHQDWRLRKHAPRTCWATSTSTFLEQFALAEGRKGGEFYTPRSVVQPPRRDAGAVPGSRVRPLLRLLRYVRPVGGVHPRPRQRERQRR